MNLSTRQLRAFIALAEEQHFTRAAQRCHLTQPAFSALIRNLEEATGVRLFDRSTRHVELTAEGRLLEIGARRWLTDLELTLEDLHSHMARQRGHVTVAALPSLSAGWLPPLLAQFQQDCPGITLDLRDALLDPCLDLVASGEADFAVAAQRPDMSDLEGQLLHADRFYLVCPADHPLTQRKQVRVQDALRWPWIAMARNSSVRKHLDQVLGEKAPAPWFEVEHLATATGLVLAGLGIALVPAMTLFHFERPGLRILALSGKVPERKLYLIKRKGRTLSVAAQSLYDMLLAHKPAGQ